MGVGCIVLSLQEFACVTLRAHHPKYNVLDELLLKELQNSEVIHLTFLT